MKTVTVRLKVPTERRLQIFPEILTSISLARTEEGCIRCSFTRSVEDENEFLLIEEWQSFELLEKHIDLHLLALLDGISRFLAEPWEMTLGIVFIPYETERPGELEGLDKHQDETARRALEGD